MTYVEMLAQIDAYLQKQGDEIWAEALRLHAAPIEEGDRVIDCAPSVSREPQVGRSLIGFAGLPGCVKNYPPQRTHCACGAELMGDLAKTSAECGDCAMAGEFVRPRGNLDERIAAAQSAKDHDPTSAWGAGATPGYEWPE